MNLSGPIKSKPLILYPAGGGGRWLNKVLFYADKREYGGFPSSVNKINFHMGPSRNDYFIMDHENTSLLSDYYTFNGHCNFNIYLNEWIKLRQAENYENFNNLKFEEKIYVLSNSARWRLGPEFYNIYERKIDLDYANIFLNPIQFRSQLLTILHNHCDGEYISSYITQDYINSAIDAFKITVIDPQLHIGNVNSLGWLGWCHAFCLLNEVTIPVNVLTEVMKYQDWLSETQDWIIKKTQPLLL